MVRNEKDALVKVIDMIWETLLYVLGVCAGVSIVMRSPSLSSVKHWYNVSFLQGLGLITWGVGNLLTLYPLYGLQKICLTSCIFTYAFFLLSLHALQHSTLAYASWKTVFDSVMLIATFITMVVLHQMAYDPNTMEHIPYMIPVQGGVFLMIPAITLIVENWQVSGPQSVERMRRGLLVMATILFAGYSMLQPIVPTPVMIALGVTSLALLVGAHRGLDNRKLLQIDQPEYRYLFQKLTFCKRDIIMVQAMLMLCAALLFGAPEIPSYGRIGLWVAILFGCIRVYFTIRDNRTLVNETFYSAARLEQQYEEQLALTQKSNEQLRQVLGLKQNYERLLIASNEQSLREVTYETLQQVIEELVETWYSKIDSLVYLRLSLESQNQFVYFQAEKGERNDPPELHRVSGEIVVHEDLDSALTPRFVRLEAYTVAENSQQKELEQSLFQLLLVNVRGLAQRCLHQHQALELRFMESEMELARRIQSMLVPKEQLTLAGLRARAVYAPFTYVGGDYIDYIRVDERYTCFIVADVSGHGLPASLLASGIRTAVRAVLQKSWSPDEVLTRLNQLLYDDLSKTRSYVTMLVALYDADEHALLLSRAGHPRPLYLSATQKMVLPCVGGVGLGLSADSTYKLEKVPLKEEGFLLLYTDGFVESGRKKVVRCIHTWLQDLSLLMDKHERDSEYAMDCVESYIWEMTREEQQTDDMSVLILQFQSTSEQPFPEIDAVTAPPASL